MRTSLFLIVFASFLAGCAGTSGVVGGGDGWGVAGWNNQHARRTRGTDPCQQPVRADALTQWATELDGGRYHDRKAGMTASTGSPYPQCWQQEQAGSRTTMGRPHGGSPTSYYGEPQIQGWTQPGQKPGWGPYR